MAAPEYPQVTLRWAGVEIDGSPSLGRLELRYCGPALLDLGEIPVTIYPTELFAPITRRTIVAPDGSEITVGWVEWLVPPSNDLSFLGAGGTYELTERLENGRGRRFNFVADKDAPGGVIWINAIAPSDPISGTVYPSVSFADVASLRTRFDDAVALVDVAGIKAQIDALVVGTRPAALFSFDSEASWSRTHNLGRLPVVTCIVDGQPVSAPTVVTDTHVLVTWPVPVSGTMILT